MTNNTSDLHQHDKANAWALARAVTGLTFDPNGEPLSVSTEANEVTIAVSAGGNWHSDQTLSADAARMLDVYLPYAASGKTLTVLAQLGQSLDGHIATETGHSHYITGQEGLDHLHRLRALSDVVVVGAGTVVADNPRLTVRRVEGQNPVRVIIDPRGRTTGDRQLFIDGAAPTLVLTTQTAFAKRPWQNVEAIAVPDDDGKLSPTAIVEALSTRGFKRILIEGGGVTISRFLQDGALNRMHVCVAPLVIGSGLPAISLPSITHLDQALRPPCRHYSMGDDVLFDLDLG